LHALLRSTHCCHIPYSTASCIPIISSFFSRSHSPRYLHSFPTRRSSDLHRAPERPEPGIHHAVTREHVGECCRRELGEGVDVHAVTPTLCVRGRRARCERQSPVLLGVIVNRQLPDEDTIWGKRYRIQVDRDRQIQGCSTFDAGRSPHLELVPQLQGAVTGGSRDLHGL